MEAVGTCWDPLAVRKGRTPFLHPKLEGLGDPLPGSEGCLRSQLWQGQCPAPRRRKGALSRVLSPRDPRAGRASPTAPQRRRRRRPGSLWAAGGERQAAASPSHSPAPGSPPPAAEGHLCAAVPCRAATRLPSHTGSGRGGSAGRGAGGVQR